MLYPSEHEVWGIVVLWDRDEELSRSRKICCTFVLQQGYVM